MTTEKEMWKALDKFHNDVENEEKLLQLSLNEYSEYTLKREKKRDKKRTDRGDTTPTTPHKPISIIEQVAEYKKWKKDPKRVPSLGFVHQHICNANYIVDVLDDLRRKGLEYGNRLQRSSQLYTKLTHIERYHAPLDRTDIDKTLDPLDPKAVCWNCGLFIQLKYKSNKRIPKRTENTVCWHNSGRIQRAKMDEHIAQQRATWKAEKDRKEQEEEKHKKHLKRSAVDGD